MNTRFLHCIVFLLYVMCAIYITFPLIFNPAQLTTGFGDELLIAWIHRFVQHQLLTDPIHLFHANIYYPFINSLAYSDAFITTSILTYPVMLLLKEPIAAVNITLFTSISLLGFSTYLLTNYLLKDKLLSFFAGLLICFSPAVLDKYIHIQILAIYFISFAVYFFFHFISTKKTRFLILTMLCFVLQTYNSFMPGYFILFSLSIIGIMFYFKNKKSTIRLLTMKNITIVVVSLLLIIPVALPYYEVSKTYHYTRNITDTIHFALQPEDLVITNNFSRLSPLLNQELFLYRLPDKNVEIKPGFIGGVFFILTILSFFFILRSWRRMNTTIKSLFLIATLGLILSFGPFLHLGRMTIHHPFPIPLPYVLFYYLVPGAQGFRNSARFEMLFILFAAILCSFALQQLLKKQLQTKKLVIIVLSLFVVLEYNFPMRFEKMTPISQFPKVNEWLRTTPRDSVIIEMPIFTWDIQPEVFKENRREYYSTTDFRDRVNGASGYSPDEWQQLTKSFLITFPNSQTIMTMKKIGIDYIVVHTSDYNEIHNNHLTVSGVKMKSGKKIIQELSRHSTVSLTKIINDDYIYQIK